MEMSIDTMSKSLDTWLNTAQVAGKVFEPSTKDEFSAWTKAGVGYVSFDGQFYSKFDRHCDTDGQSLNRELELFSRPAAGGLWQLV